MSPNKMRNRLRLAMKYPHDCEEALKLEGKVLAFAASEVALAMAPREASPELATATKWLREQQEQRCDIIADELTRLRAHVAIITADRDRKVKALRELMDAADEMLEQPLPSDELGSARVARLSLAVLAAAREEGEG